MAFERETTICNTLFLPLLLFETLTFSCLCFCLLLARLLFLALLLVDIEGGVDPAASANSSQTVMKAADLPVTTCHTNNIYYRVGK